MIRNSLAPVQFGRETELENGGTMAQASTVQQREPSMEEILASIRRIIEDNESGHRDESIQEQEESSFRSVSEGLRPSLTTVPPSPPAEEAHTPTQQAEAEKADQSSQASSGLNAPFDFGATDMEEDDDDFSIPVAANAPVSSSGQDESLRWQSSGAGSPQGNPGDVDRRPIISRVPGRKVAAAFEELNEALLANRRKTLDQMAEEMLQPMLQDWLDNNLPQLVERLVREEIERIARGI